MKTWESDKAWTDKLLPEIKAILGVHLIGEPPMEEDAERNTDLMVLRMDAVRIGCRVRTNSYVDRYGDEFTIRAGRPSGVKTELTKIIEGWGDYFFYGFATQDKLRLAKWTLADMRVFRIEYMRKLAACSPGNLPGTSKNNLDGSSHFAAFKWRQFSPALIVAHSNQAHVEAAE